ncbi:MAG: TlpA family protein disulfide reductase [Micromonosporaceae bacterium]|nr:TlpA family protein disulfide reductase [Micromonosporaceae bacterium]
MSWPAVALVAVALAFAATFAAAGCSTGGSRSGTVVFPVKDRKPAPPVTGHTLEGAPYSLADQRGKVVVLNFWATWCAPCVQEATALEATYESTKDSGVTFLGVNVHDIQDKALAFQSGRLTYPSLFDPPSSVALNFPDLAVTVPSTVVIDRQGRVAAAVRTAVTQDGLTALVRQIATEP